MNGSGIVPGPFLLVVSIDYVIKMPSGLHYSDMRI